MSKTNSNSITSILTIALNIKESDFRKKMIELFKETIKENIPEDIVFYDCTHSPLLYKEMNGKEVDIIARIPGTHKPIIMIEVKANTGEPLQESQGKKGEYEKTSKVHKISLIYIIPTNYIHKSELPDNSKIITWEKILEYTKHITITFDSQITQFVEISNDDNILTEYEKKLLTNEELLLSIYRTKLIILEKMHLCLDKQKRKITYEEDKPWGVGFYYTYKKQDYFLGFNPYYYNENFLALDIAENINNFELGDSESLYFEDGYYFIPILNNEKCYGDEKLLKQIRDDLKLLEINQLEQTIVNNFSTFVSLQNKIGDEDFSSLFKKTKEEFTIDISKYKKIIKKYSLD